MGQCVITGQHSSAPHKSHDLAIAFVVASNKDKKISEEEFYNLYLEELKKFKELVTR